jgi:SAM-dependent methyltransferase
LLPFPDCSFDAVLCQMALMFFRHRGAALAEMARVVTAAGMVAIAVPGRLDRQVAFAPFVDMAARHVGPDALSLLSAYFVCGDMDELSGQVESAGLEVSSATVHTGTYRAPSVDAFVTTEVESTPLIERITPEVYRRIRDEAHDILRPFTAAGGRVEAPFETNIVAACPRSSKRTDPRSGAPTGAHTPPR